MISKEKSKKAIFQRVQTYNQTKSKIKNISETDTRVKFIDPILEALGWDIFGKKIPDEVLREETVKGKESAKKRADYTLRINGVTRLVVEAKAIGEDLEKDEYITQATNYAYNKACNWAVLTDFENIILFFVDRNKRQSFYTISLSDVDNFDQNFETLWYLSKESVLNSSLEYEAKRRGTQKDKIQINEQLYEDLKEWRRLLSNDIRKRYDGMYPDHIIDEIVQRIIDRLIFIRKVEDSGVEEKTLDQITRRFDKNTYDEIKKLFIEYNGYYNSKLFGEETNDKHICDKIEISDNVIQGVVIGMYHPKGSKIEYNFDAIDADILGNIYEQYLGFILQKGKLKSEIDGHAHRKEQGIYYTPTYVVDYIVRNTLGTLLSDKKVDPAKIKVLDPACGSGSFLIKAFDYFSNYYQKKYGKEQQSTLRHAHEGIFKRRANILKQNIFGVDLDPKAVEIAQLNLLLKLAEQRARLPTLRSNIRAGNSLIDDENIAKDSAFKWDEKYPDIIQYDENGTLKKGFGFDIVIGNPPYIFSRNFIPDENKNYFSKKYVSFEYQSDLYILFLEKSINLLKNDGLLGLIVPNSWFGNLRTTNIRKYILENTTILNVVYCPKETFNIGVETAIIITKKRKYRDSKDIFVFDYDKNNNLSIYGQINQSALLNNKDFIFNFRLTKDKFEIINRIEKAHQKLIDFCEITRGVNAYDKYQGQSEDIIKNRAYHSDHKIDTSYIPELKGKDVGWYYYSWNGKTWIKYGNWLAAPRDPRYFTGKRIILRQIPAQRLMATIINEDFCIDQTVFIAKPNNPSLSNYLLGILNSKLMAYYFKYRNDEIDEIFPKVKLQQFKELPIIITDDEKQKRLTIFVDKMLSLNKRLNEIGESKTDTHTQLEDDVQRIDNEINDLVGK